MVYSSSTGLLVPAVAASLILLYGCITAVYRAFFDPLSKVPGPKLYAISNIPYLYHVIRGEWPRVLKKLHDQYGPAVRFSNTDVSFTTPDAWKTIYGHRNTGEPTFEKDRRFYGASMSGYESVLTANRADHRRMRRVLSHAFSEKALRGQEDIMNHYVDLFVSKLGQKASNNEAVDMMKWFNFTTFDLIGDLAFGEPFGCLESGGYHPWVAMIFDGIKLSAFRELMQRMPILSLFKGYLLSEKMKTYMREHYIRTSTTVRKRIQSGKTDRDDFMSYILRHNGEKGMNEHEMIENANTMIVAGSETTATLLSGATFQLLTNPETYKKLVEEVRLTFKSESEITLSAVKNLEYMLAVLTEGFRMYPPVPSGLPRRTPKGGEFIEGYWIPEHTIVSVGQWSAYQSERYWHEPQNFIPERWLGDSRFACDIKQVLNPFSIGPRNCIGKNLAYAEMRLILARLIWNFDLELLPESRNWNQQDIYKLWEKGELKVKLRAANFKDKQAAEVS